MTLTEFLIARIDEDEELARRGSRHNARAVYANDNYGCLLVDPARVLAECEAKRRIVELHFGNDPGPDAECGACGDIGGYYSQAWPCPTIKALAAVYADHPDYREEWRP